MKYLNQFVIVRADRAGVFFGKIKAKDGDNVVLEQVRKLHYWEGAAAVEEIAMIGTKNPYDCRFTVTVPEMEIAQAIQIIPCTEEAISVIQNVKEWKA
jgi:hypothetical protein